MRNTFFLTGSARGLGRSIAIAILDAGHNLVATAASPNNWAILSMEPAPFASPLR
jgi:NAD(P)-dependent dehydrogenase (short-subunit alcohol dehydrogenase family)